MADQTATAATNVGTPTSHPDSLIGTQRHQHAEGYAWQGDDRDPVDLLDRLTTLIRAVPDMMFRLAPDGTFLEAKRGAQDEFAFEPGQFLGQPIRAVLPSELAERTHAAMAEARRGGSPTFEYTLRVRGRPHWFEARVMAVADEFVVTVRDTTQTRQAENDLTAFFELSPDLAVIADFEGRFLRLNEVRWVEALGWSRDVMLGQPYLSLVHPDDLESTMAVVSSLAEGHGVVGFENRYRTSQGDYRWLEWRAQPILDRGIIVCIARDVTVGRAARDRELVMAEISAARSMSATTPGALAESINRIVENAVPCHCSVVLVPPGGGARIPHKPISKPRRIELPIRDGDTTMAVLTVSRHRREPAFTEAELALLEEITNHLSPLIERASLYQGLIESAELLAATDTGIAKIALDFTITSWNPAAERISGWSSERIVGRSLTDLASDAFVTWATAQRDHVLRTGETVRTESERHRPDGTSFWAEISMAPIHDWTGATVAIAVAFTDVTERRQAKLQLELMARTDSLTGIANRAEMERVLSDRLALGRSGALLFIDLDGFKGVNDRHGHGAGDQVLREAGVRLRAAARATDVVGRFGGDEFGLLMDCGRDPAPDADLKVAGRILALLSEPFSVAGHLIELGASCGIAHFPRDAADLDTLLLRADSAMYAAKERGGGHAQRFRPGLDARLRDLSEEHAMIRRGMQQREFSIVYQPILSLPERNVVALEALARWDRDGRTLLPASFLAAAEDSGLIIPLGYQLIELACDQFVAGRSALPECGLWINLSRRQFASEDLPARLADILARHDLSPELVTVEITETTLFDDPRQARETLAALGDLGTSIALDDFGTGYSSLGALHDLPVDAVKIDQVFVGRLSSSGAPADSRDRALVEAAVHMGHALGLAVVAEGVEDPTQLRVLSELGCDLAQGHLLGAPTTADAAFGAVGDITPG